MNSPRRSTERRPEYEKFRMGMERVEGTPENEQGEGYGTGYPQSRTG